MTDPYVVPTLLLLSVVTAQFGVIYLRQRTISTGMMFAAWLAICARLAIEWMAPAGENWYQTTGDCILLATPILFVTAFSPDRFGPRRILFGAICLVPAVFFGIFIDCCGNSRAGSGISIASVLALTLLSLLWASRSLLYPRWFSFPGVVIGGGLTVVEIVRNENDVAVCVLLAVMFGFAALGFGLKHARRRPGSVITLVGLTGWAAIFAAYVVGPHTAQFSAELTQISDLFKILTAVGMMVYLLEQELTATAQARRREEELREELRRYAAVDLTPLPNKSQLDIFLPVCQVVADYGPFGGCAIVLNTRDSAPLVLCHAGMPAELTEPLLEAIARHRSEPHTGTPSSADLVSLPLHGGSVPGYLLPLVSHASEVEGWMWLTAPRGGVDQMGPRALAPLQSLASRLSMALQNGELTQRLIRTDRLAGLGKLAGGIAHELNNPLTIVKGYAELIQDGSSDRGTAEQAGIILREADRMKRIISDMRNFWRASGPDRGEVDIVELIGSVAMMYRNELQRRKITLETNANCARCDVEGSYEGLRQVMVQVMNNAMEAIDSASDSQRTIRVDTSCVAGHIHIVISDGGPGFAEPDRAFDPFYTTKAPRDGTGLGLSVCYGLVRQYGGDISAMNIQPHGGAVIIELPLIAGQNPESEPAAIAV